MGMPGRKFSAGSAYRYGFNGKELDNEVVQYDYGFRIYDPRLERFKSVDPLTKTYPWYTPYQFAGNKPIIAIDLDGLEEYVVITRLSANGGRTVTIEYVTDKATKEAINLQYRIILTKDKNGNTTSVGDKLTDKKVLRIVERPDGTEESHSFGKSLSKEERSIIDNNSTKEEFDGAPNGTSWTINVNKKDYDSDLKRNLSMQDENIAERTFAPPVTPPPPRPIPFNGVVLRPNQNIQLPLLSTYGDQATPPSMGINSATQLANSLRNTGIRSITIQPIIYDPTGGQGANIRQSNGASILQNSDAQYRVYSQIIQRISGVNVTVLPTQSSSIPVRATLNVTTR